MDELEKDVVGQTAEELADENAAFEAHFSGEAVDDVIETSTGSAGDDAVVDAGTDVDVETSGEVVQQADKITPTPVLFAGMTEEEIVTAVKKAKEVDDVRDAMYKMRNTFNGRLGSMAQQLIERPATKSDDNSVRISKYAKDKLSDEYPELAELLFGEDPDTKQEPEQQEQPLPQINEVKPQPSQSAPGYTEDQKLELRLLKRDHKDWEKVVVSGEFNSWLSEVKGKAFEYEFNNSWDADHVSSTISEFKAHLSKNNDAQKVEKSTKTSLTDAKKRRLQAAITPRGSGSTPVANDENDEEAAMIAAFST